VQVHRQIGGAIGGETLNSNRSPRRFPSGRMCGYDNCDTCLSIYNNGTYCSQHAPGIERRARDKKIV
jgi:hypothetical protein